MYWTIEAKLIEEPGEPPVIELGWGWTYGMSNTDLENYAEDAPIGSDFVQTTINDAIVLRDKLTELIEIVQKSSVSTPKRRAPKITIDELKKFLPDDEEHILQLIYSDDVIQKDLSEVEFDFENFTTHENLAFSDISNIIGYHTHNGLSFLGCMAGGDWEIPVFFILYWDGTRIRAYIPGAGNSYNVENKKAYGNDEEADRGLSDCGMTIDQHIVLLRINRTFELVVF